MLDHEPQPMSKPGIEDVNSAVIEDLRIRGEVGAKKYGTPLMTFNGRNALADAYQEALDMSVYLKQLLMEERFTQLCEGDGAEWPMDKDVRYFEAIARNLEAGGQVSRARAVRYLIARVMRAEGNRL